jgi:hypothetical protein
MHDSLPPQHTGTSAARWRPRAAARYVWELLGLPACIGIILARCPLDISRVGWGLSSAAQPVCTITS